MQREFQGHEMRALIIFLRNNLFAGIPGLQTNRQLLTMT